MNARLDQVAERARVSKSEWVSGALEALLAARADALDDLSRLDAPTCDIGQMLDGIAAGRS